jgi:hypothetical protein
MIATRSLIFNALFYLNLVVLMIVGLPTMLFDRRERNAYTLATTERIAIFRYEPNPLTIRSKHLRQTEPSWS